MQKRAPKKADIRKMRSFLKILKIATIQRPLQNGQFGSKNKIAKKMQKTTLEA